MKLDTKKWRKLSGLIVEQNEDPSNAEEGKKKIFVLVGPPSAGKSTWIQGEFDGTPYVINRE